MACRVMYSEMLGCVSMYDTQGGAYVVVRLSGVVCEVCSPDQLPDLAESNVYVHHEL